MSVFKKLFGSLFGGGGQRDDAGANAFWMFVRCAACGERIRIRINREHDLSAEFEGESDRPTAYHLHKEIVGRNCFRRIQVDVSFDAQRHPIDQQISGGSFLTRQEFESPQAGATDPVA